MFLALKEIRAARGRVALMAGVVGLITLLLIMLTGLTGGLAGENTSALRALGPERVAFSTAEPSFTQSVISETDLKEAPTQTGAQATPLGIAQTRLGEGDTAVAVALFALPDGAAAPAACGGSGCDVAAGSVLVSAQAAADSGLAVGDTVTLGGIDTRVGAIVDDLAYSHVPVVWGDTALWREVSRAPGDAVGTALLLEAGASASLDDAGPAAGLHSFTLGESLKGLPAYSSERGSLLTMQGLLYAISALVTVAFLSVWTIQRTRDLSILRALGATTRYLLRDAMGQAAILLALGGALGAALGTGLGWAASQGVPFAMSPVTVAAPTAGVWALGMAGALLATRRVTKADPLAALAGNG